MSCAHTPDVKCSSCRPEIGFQTKEQVTFRKDGTESFSICLHLQAFGCEQCKASVSAISSARDRYKAALIEISKLSNGRGPDCAVYLDQIGCVITAALTPAKEAGSELLRDA